MPKYELHIFEYNIARNCEYILKNNRRNLDITTFTSRFFML